MLHYLAQHAGPVVAGGPAHPVGAAYGGADKTVDVHVSWLARKIGEAAQHAPLMHTVRGVGIKLARPMRLRRILRGRRPAPGVVSLLIRCPRVRTLEDDRAVSTATLPGASPWRRWAPRCPRPSLRLTTTDNAETVPGTSLPSGAELASRRPVGGRSSWQKGVANSRGRGREQVLVAVAGAGGADVIQGVRARLGVTHGVTGLAAARRRGAAAAPGSAWAVATSWPGPWSARARRGARLGRLAEGNCRRARRAAGGVRRAPGCTGWRSHRRTARAREGRTVADLSHRLRTPLTACARRRVASGQRGDGGVCWRRRAVGAPPQPGSSARPGRTAGNGPRA